MTPQALNRLRWRCTRRAFLELDLLLGKFLEEEFNKLSEAQAQIFVQLADWEDNDLWPLVNGSVVCESPPHAEIVAMLRQIHMTSTQE